MKNSASSVHPLYPIFAIIIPSGSECKMTVGRQRPKKVPNAAAAVVDAPTPEQESGAGTISSKCEIVAQFVFCTNAVDMFEVSAGASTLQFWNGDEEHFTIVFQETEGSKATNFLSALYGLSSVGKEDEAIDEVIDCFDDLLTRKDLQLCDDIFQSADVKKMAPSVSLAILSMTVVEKNALVKRAAFASRLRINLVRARGAKEAGELLAGLQ